MNSQLESITTRELLEEIKARAENTPSPNELWGLNMVPIISDYLDGLPDSMLDYKPVDG